MCHRFSKYLSLTVHVCISTVLLKSYATSDKSDYIYRALSLSHPESKNLPGQPPLEFALGQAVQCLKHMSRNGLGSAAFTGVQDIVSS